MKLARTIGLHLAAVAVAALIHVRWHPEQRPEQRRPHGWADWQYTTRLLALDRPLHLWREEDDPDPEGWSHRHWHEMAVRAEQSGDLDLALALWERYRPRPICGLDPEPEWAAKAYADLCYRMGRRACFLTLYVRLMGQTFEDEPGQLDFTFMSRLPDLGIDRARFLRGLVYEFPSPKHMRSERPEVDPFSLALAIERARLTDVMLPWLRREASNSALNAHNRSRAQQTLRHLREQAGSLLLRTDARSGRSPTD
jgi:hypothetical protein